MNTDDTLGIDGWPERCEKCGNNDVDKFIIEPGWSWISDLVCQECGWRVAVSD